MWVSISRLINRVEGGTHPKGGGWASGGVPEAAMDLILGLSHNQGGRFIMQVIVSCPLIVPDEPIDRNALEAHIQAWGRALRALAFQQCWQQYQAHAPACPRCQQPTTVADGSRPYALRTLFGTVRPGHHRLAPGGHAGGRLAAARLEWG